MSGSTPSQYRCTSCKSTSVNAKNLVVFIDGTSNEPGSKKTNVVKLHDVVFDGDCPELTQSKHYLKGIGTYDVESLSPLGRADKLIMSSLEMAFARNVKINVKNAYRWLVDRYQEGDQVYLFGFSRGAYQVRALASMIHEVGLVKSVQQERIDQNCNNGHLNDPNDANKTLQRRIDEAYRNYRSIDPSDPDTRKTAIGFKKEFCWPGVRIHFIGVWDTVSSLGLIKQDVHITSSASVSNACHFRHALALDERRVKFLPEYFSEVNAHRAEVKSPRSLVSDVKEVWFAGYHSDIGGQSRLHTERLSYPAGDDHHAIHAGNVPLIWMKQEAVANGLVFKQDHFSWDPKDVDLGRKEAMNAFWRFVETLPVRHQVSFSGTGKHARRWHLFRPRSVIPNQHIHLSILSGDVYKPRATLRGGVSIPTLSSGGLWVTEHLDDGATTRFLTPSLHDQKAALRSLEKVMSLLGPNDGLITKSQISEQSVSNRYDQRFEEFITKQFDFARFALAIVYDVTSNLSASEELVKKARDSLVAILSSSNQPSFTLTLDFLRVSTRNESIRRRFIAHEEVVGALFHALEQTTERQRETLFPLVMDILCYLIEDDDQRGNVINQLNARSALSKAGDTRLSLVLEVKLPSHLIASLKMIASLARYHSFLCRDLKPRIIELAKKGRGPVGAAAVETLAALNVSPGHDIPFANILSYFSNTLPRLDAEVGCASTDVAFVLPPVFRVDDSGGIDDNDPIMRKILLAIDSRDAHQRILSTLTLLKLCRDSMIQAFCSKNNVLNIFLRQLELKETSLLAAYALKTCLKHDKWTTDFDFRVAAKLILPMFDKGWFDDAIGQVEGSKIFRELMMAGDLKRQVIEVGIITTLINKFEDGESHDIRMSLICLDILGGESQVYEELSQFIYESLGYLRDKKKKTQMKGVKILSALAQTTAGERALKLHLTTIVKMLLPHAGQSPVPRSQLFAPAAALHNMCRNETLREEIEKSPDFAKFKGLRRDSSLYPKTTT